MIENDFGDLIEKPNPPSVQLRRSMSKDEGMFGSFWVINTLNLNELNLEIIAKTRNELMLKNEP